MSLVLVYLAPMFSFVKCTLLLVNLCFMVNYGQVYVKSLSGSILFRCTLINCTWMQNMLQLFNLKKTYGNNITYYF